MGQNCRNTLLINQKRLEQSPRCLCNGAPCNTVHEIMCSSKVYRLALKEVNPYQGTTIIVFKHKSWTKYIVQYVCAGSKASCIQMWPSTTEWGSLRDSIKIDRSTCQLLTIITIFYTLWCKNDYPAIFLSKVMISWTLRCMIPFKTSL